MAMDDDLLFIGCADGIVRCFRSGRLDFVATLPLPHHLGVDVSSNNNLNRIRIVALIAISIIVDPF